MAAVFTVVEHQYGRHEAVMWKRSIRSLSDNGHEIYQAMQSTRWAMVAFLQTGVGAIFNATIILKFCYGSFEAFIYS